MPTSPRRFRIIFRADSAVRPYNRLPSIRSVFSLSFRGRKAPVGIRIPAPAGAESLPPSAREAARSAGRRDVDPPHPRCSSVGGDAHAVERSGTSTLGVHRPVCRGINLKGRSAPRRGVLLPSAAKVPKNAVQTCGLKIPYAPLPVAYLAYFSHANTVLCKFPLNVVSSLLL